MTRDQLIEHIAIILLTDNVHDDETARDILDFVEPEIRAWEDMEEIGDIIIKARGKERARLKSPCPLCLRPVKWIECDNMHCTNGIHPYCDCVSNSEIDGIWVDEIDKMDMYIQWCGHERG